MTAIPASASTIPLVTPESTISGVAGNGTAGFSGDGGPAVWARVNQPRDTDLGPDGSLYITDTYNHRIRRIAPDGTITTIAGTGASGYNGDNRPATQASLYWPHDVLVDDTGVVYVADSNNHRIRRIAPDGTITTVAGRGTSGFSGDGGPATEARLKNPKGLALFGDSLYIADGNNNRIRQVDLTTGIIATVAGTGVKGFSGDGGPATSAALNYPQRIAVDELGRIYIADSNNHRIRRFTPGGTITTIAGSGPSGNSGDGGPATAARLTYPRGVEVVGTDAIYIADSNNHRIRMVDLHTGIITAVAATGARGYSGDGGPAGSARMYNPRGVTVDPSGRLYVADTFNNAIRVITPELGENTPPMADFTVSCDGTRCIFDASPSSDDDGTITGYRWVFGDGTEGTGRVTSYIYGSEGSFTVELTVTDNRGASSATTDIVTVTNAPPVAAFTATCEGLSCSFDAAKSTDVDGSISTYTWTFGDETTGQGMSVDHDYTAEDSFTVELTVTDNRGASSATTDIVTVTNAPPVAAFTATCDRLDCVLDASAAVDPDGTIDAFRWSLGDGTQASGPVVAHSFAADGTYPVTLTVTDNRGTEGQTAQDVTVTSVIVQPSPLEFRGVESVGGAASARPSVTVPAAVEPGDTLLLFVTNGSSRAPAPPTGWTWLGTQSDVELRTDVYWRSAVAGDAGGLVPVDLLNSSGVPQTATNTLTLVAYSGVGEPPVSALAGRAEPSSVVTGSHATPGIDVPDDDSLVLSYWADRTSNTSSTSVTTRWTPPSGQTLRADAYNSASGGRVTSLLTDDGGVTGSGSRTGLTAVANGQTMKAAMWSIVLRGA